MKPKATVMMTVYNVRDFVGDAMRSVLDQDFDDIELIVVDDGSTDGSLEVELSFRSDQRVRLLQNSTNRGEANSVNRALSTANGDYLFQIGGDDVFLPGRIRKMVELAERSPGRVYFSDFRRIDEKGLTIRASYSGHMPPDGDAYSWFLAQEFPGHGTFMMPRAVLDRVGTYVEKQGTSEDFEFVLRAVEKHDVAVLREPLYGYRKRAGQKSTINRAFKRRIDIKILESHLRRNGERLDEASKFKVVSRMRRYARQAGDVRGLVRLTASPTYLKHVARQGPKRLLRGRRTEGLERF